MNHNGDAARPGSWTNTEAAIRFIAEERVPNQFALVPKPKDGHRNMVVIFNRQGWVSWGGGLISHRRPLLRLWCCVLSKSFRTRFQGRNTAIGFTGTPGGLSHSTPVCHKDLIMQPLK